MSSIHLNLSKAVVTRFHERIGEGDISGALSLMDASAVIEFYGPSEIPIAGRYCGYQELRKFFNQLSENLEIQEFQVHEVIAESEKVVVSGHERSTVLQTGRTFEVPWVQIFEVHEGKITRLRDYFETASVLQAFAQDIEIQA